MRWLGRRRPARSYPRGDDGDGGRLSRSRAPHVLFSLAPAAQSVAVAIVGCGHVARRVGFSALTQHDIKRILAYSTVSQIGYMFLALGVGAWQAAIFHFITHACFKALLFLGAGW